MLGFLGVAAIGMQLFGGFMRGKAEREAGESAEALGEYKAQLARKYAAEKRVMTAEDQRLKRREMRKTLARNREITAGSGLMMTGTPAAMQLDVIEDFAYDIAKTGYEGEQEARRSEDMAEIYLMEGKAAARAGKIGQQASIFGGIGDAISTGFGLFG